MDGDIEETAWTYFAVCVPIVVFFAPFGSFLSSHFHRQVLAALIYVLDTVALVRDHSSITSSKRWVGGVRKWQFLMIYSTVNHQRGGWVGLKVKIMMT